MRQLLAVLAVVVAVGALLTFGRESDVRDSSLRSHGVPETGPRLSELESELEVLRMDVADLMARARASGTTRSVAEVHPDHADLEARIAKLEAAVAGLAGAPRGPEGAGAVERVPKDPVEATRDLDQLIEAARNPGAPEHERLVALRLLRWRKLADGTDARLAVVQEMVRLAESSPDADVRADVWRQLSHVTDRSMLQPLLSALQNDSADKVREEAAETLADFLPDESVRRALQFAAENDRNNKVRSQASEALRGGRR
jgi:HEAT repeats